MLIQVVSKYLSVLGIDEADLLRWAVGNHAAHLIEIYVEGGDAIANTNNVEASGGIIFLAVVSLQEISSLLDSIRLNGVSR